MRHTGFHHLFADQHDISLLPLPKIRGLVITVFKTVESADLHITVWPSAQPAALSRYRRIEQLQTGALALSLAHVQGDLIALLSVPPVPNTG